ncbi:hypothetical protein ACEWY4_020071 [Coilia grayii]|uniref:Chromatin target of PRMT1 protein C-terminal domain-containing protein n=1 Tax=Coilia grayii TaxID=363190 RepID=A0ABD1IQS0_9TELE
MASQAATKLLVKSTTKVSLNERFTNMLKNKQPPAVNVRATMQQQNSASARNRRLAQQMENRPSVQAALHNKPVRTLKQRLGVQARLGRGGGGAGTRGFPATGFRGMVRGGVRGRGAFFRGAMAFRGVARGRGGPTRLAVRRGIRQWGGQVSRAGALVSRGARTGLGGRGRGVGARGRGAFAGRGNFAGRGGVRGRGGARGRGRGWFAGRSTLTREQLDNQLDDYMSKTKGHLDAELDAYMAQAEDME